jgi:hypothetical protein
MPAATVSAHHHDWPTDAEAWQRVGNCQACGLATLALFVRSSDWVVRRVEKVEFLDHRTVRRRMSVDYVSPRTAPRFRRSSGTDVRVVPLTIMRKRTLTNFDLRDAGGRALPLLGLRETQSLSCGMLRAWGAATLLARGAAARLQPVDDTVRAVLDDIVAGDLAERDDARGALRAAAASHRTDALGVLGGDDVFMGLVDRLAGSFLLLTLDEGAADERRIVKFAYDEALTLEYTESPTPATSGRRPPPTRRGSRRASRRRPMDRRRGSPSRTWTRPAGPPAASSRP